MYTIKYRIEKLKTTVWTTLSACVNHVTIVLKQIFYANRIASHIAAQHVIAVGDILQGEALELTAHGIMPILDADFQEGIAE